MIRVKCNDIKYKLTVRGEERFTLPPRRGELGFGVDVGAGELRQLLRARALRRHRRRRVAARRALRARHLRRLLLVHAHLPAQAADLRSRRGARFQREAAAERLGAAPVRPVERGHALQQRRLLRGVVRAQRVQSARAVDDAGVVAHERVERAARLHRVAPQLHLALRPLARRRGARRFEVARLLFKLRRHRGERDRRRSHFGRRRVLAICVRTDLLVQRSDARLVGVRRQRDVARCGARCGVGVSRRGVSSCGVSGGGARR